MQLQANIKGKYTVITLVQEFDEDIDIEYFNLYLDSLIDKNIKFIAIKFSENSHLYSGAISVLIRFKKIVLGKDGDLCIVEPSKIILETFKLLELDKQFKIYMSLNDLPE